MRRTAIVSRCRMFVFAGVISAILIVYISSSYFPICLLTLTRGGYKQSGKNVQLWYIQPKIAELNKGEPFILDKAVLDHLGIPPKRHITLNKKAINNFVFVTASSYNHFTESLDAIASVQHHFPNYTIVYYDLGLCPWQITKLLKTCNVIYRKFQFHLFPSHVGEDLGACAWKPIVIQEVMRVYDGVMWFDASIRFMTSDLSGLHRWTLKSGGAAIWIKTGHSIYAATHPTSYLYLPANLTLLKKTEMRGGGLMMMYNTKDIYEKLLKWFVLCSLEKNCISPIYEFSCQFDSHNPYNQYTHCHRYDQSVFNLLYISNFDFLPDINLDHIAKVHRRVSHMFQMRSCA